MVLFYSYDITNSRMIDYLVDDLKDRNISNIDEIYHLASLASPPFYKKFPIETLDVGYIGTKNMLELAKKLNSKILKFKFFKVKMIQQWHRKNGMTGAKRGVSNFMILVSGHI